MPGSLTISHHESAVAMEHRDAARLATVLAELAYLLEIPGPNRIGDGQLAVLCEGRAPDRAELSHWARAVSAELKGRL
ncbi:hypothetical protein [Streptomyces rubellomurinus]|uniref:Uncharacterized protein n=2 Tax=Streptomyces TaxID=1883 RepID=A0A0F2T5I6_STRR3|nr:hypothetical protein [Streptomyces rubellomurinus]KJS56904.1 hypothetical protein VM98_03910 [Streptomyces rubellomurinus subsp. indigoferus]KJS58469.1 hypothetical protein VM95_33195 [Streptomyces rubellomurinus]